MKKSNMFLNISVQIVCLDFLVPSLRVVGEIQILEEPTSVLGVDKKQKQHFFWKFPSDICSFLEKLKMIET